PRLPADRRARPRTAGMSGRRDLLLLLALLRDRLPFQQRVDVLAERLADVGAEADVGGPDDPLAVEDDDGRGALDLERLADRVTRVEPDLADGGPGQPDLLLLQGRLDELADLVDLLGVVVLAQGDDDDVLPGLGVPLDELLDLRELLEARAAPGRPEVDHDDLAGEVGLRHRPGLARAFEQGQGERGGRLPD